MLTIYLCACSLLDETGFHENKKLERLIMDCLRRENVQPVGSRCHMNKQLGVRLIVTGQRPRLKTESINAA